MREAAAEMAAANRAQARVDEQPARFNQSAADLKRRRGLVKQQVISSEELQHAVDEFVANRSATQAAKHELAGIQARNGGVELVGPPAGAGTGSSAPRGVDYLASHKNTGSDKWRSGPE